MNKLIEIMNRISFDLLEKKKKELSYIRTFHTRVNNQTSCRKTKEAKGLSNEMKIQIKTETHRDENYSKNTIISFVIPTNMEIL